MNTKFFTGVLATLIISGSALAQAQVTSGNPIFDEADRAAAVAAQESAKLLADEPEATPPAAQPPAATPTPSAVTPPAQVTPPSNQDQAVAPSVAPTVEDLPGAVVTETSEVDAAAIANGAAAPVIVSSTSVVPGTVDRGLIAETSALGQEALLLQQRQAFLAQLQTTVDTIGVENTLAMYPEYAKYIDTSPMSLRSQLERVTVLNQLREEVAKANGPTEYELALAETQPVSAELGQDGLMNMPISNGSLAPAQAEAEVGLTREDVLALIQENAPEPTELTTSQVETAPQTPVYALYLNEVYGANGQMIAVVTDGTSSYKVRVGDEVSDIGVITMIDRERAIIKTDETEYTLRFR